MRFKESHAEQFVDQARLLNAEEEIHLEAGEKETRTIDPSLQLDTSDLQGFVEVEWEVLVDGIDEPIEVGEATITVLSMKTFPWDWVDSDGNDVDKEFILASLSVWTNDLERSVKELARELREKVNLKVPTNTTPVDYAEEWFSIAWSRLFEEQNRVGLLIETEDKFPKRVDVLLPRMILKRKGVGETIPEIKPLEAALLICALSRQAFGARGVRLALVMKPRDQDIPEVKDYYIAWAGASRNWRCIKMAGGHSSFQDNLAVATSEIQEVLERGSAADAELMRDGIHYTDEKSVIAIDFQKAIETHRIAKASP